MEKILTLSVQNLKEKLYIAYMRFGLEALEKNPVIEEDFPNFVNTFKASYNQMNQVYLKYDHKFYEEQVREAHKERRTAFSKFNNYIRSFTLNTKDPAKTAAAERILQIISMYGASTIRALGFREAGTQIVNLIEDIEERYESEIQLLEAGELLNELKRKQEDFDETYYSRVDYDSEAGRAAMTEARKRMTEAYRALVNIINENVPYDTEDKYQGFVRVLNVEIRTLFIHTGQSANNSSNSSADGESGITYKYITFDFANGNSQKFRLEVGAPIIVQDNTFGYIWNKEIPEFMPNKNLFFKEIPITSAEAIATFHFADHREEEIRQIVGTILHGPANTTGYYWEPTVPSTMPAEDTSYYELPLENNGGNNGSGSGGNNTGSGENTGSGGNDNTGSGGGDNTGGSSNNFTVTYKYPETGEVITTQEYEVGEKIVPPTPPTGYVWGYYPDNMPDRNVFVDALPDVIDF